VALTGDLDPRDRLTGFHDRADDLLNRVGQCRHTIPNRAPEMVFNRDPAYFGQALVDLQIAAIKRQAGEPDRRRIID
jgi:hypothetical protein